MKKRHNHPPRHPANQPISAPPAPIDTLLQRACAHHNAGQLPEAESLYRQVLQLSPDHPTALHFLGLLACQVGQNAIALDLIDRAIHISPSDAGAHFTRGNILFGLDRHHDALASYDQVLRLNSQHPEVHNNRGSALHALKQFSAAVQSYDNAIRLKPDYVEAYRNRANTFYELQQYEQSVESCNQAIRLNPSYAEAHYNRGNALQALQQYAEAIASYDRAIQFKPDYAEAFSNRGNALYFLQKHSEAVKSCDEAILLNPGYADAHLNRGNALYLLEQHREAIKSCDQAILLKPDYADAHCNRGNALLALKQYPEALESYNQALRVKPDCAYLPGIRLHVKAFLCDWRDFESECRQLEAAIARGEKAAVPFAVLPNINSPTTQKQAAEIYVRSEAPARSASPLPLRPRRDKIRIGYFSSDYYSHAISYLIAEMLERHDRDRFEILGFSFGRDSNDPMRQRVSAAMDQFLEVRSMSDREIAQLSRERSVDIAVDLAGFTRDGRPGIFAQNAAPIQINFLGYPGTMAAGYIDYLIADPTLIPESSRQHYSEKIVYLPDTYQPNTQREISTTPCTRAAEHLPEAAFVFCCFNNLYKITPAVFDLWLRILAEVEGSVLWLLEENPWAPTNLRQQAARRGIAPDRLIFAKPLPVAEHLARHRLADLFLDTTPYNAHTTASDALWAGLPLLTRIGETFAGRVAASLLRAIHLPELITTTESEYQSLAIALARDPQRHQALRQRLQQNRLTTPLFDVRTFTRHLESAYTAIYERHQAGLSPDNIHVSRRTPTTGDRQPPLSKN